MPARLFLFYLVMDNKEEKPQQKKETRKRGPNPIQVKTDRRKEASGINLMRGNNSVGNRNFGAAERERRFVEEFVLDFNASRACKAAGYSERTANSQSLKLLAKPHIIKAIKEFNERATENIIVTKQMITNELHRIAFADYTELIEMVEQSDGKGGKFIVPQFKATAMIAKGLGKLIKSMKIGRRGVEVTIHSKEHALEMLAKHIDYFNADNTSKAVSGVQVYIPDNNRGDTNIQINVVNKT